MRSALQCLNFSFPASRLDLPIAPGSSPSPLCSGLLARIYTDWQADVLPTNFSALTPAHTAVLLVPDCYFGFSVQNCTELGSLRNDNNIAMLVRGSREGRAFASACSAAGYVCTLPSPPVMPQMTGTLVVPAAGTWTFYLTSDDGSRLTLFNNTMTKNNTINYDNTVRRQGNVCVCVTSLQPAAGSQHKLGCGIQHIS